MDENVNETLFLVSEFLKQKGEDKRANNLLKAMDIINAASSIARDAVPCEMHETEDMVDGVTWLQIMDLREALDMPRYTESS